jgi:ornithine cyclodeaminase/alanine dehydrogenase-like protein (mu-crystallin family)
VLLVITNSAEPVLPADLLEPGMHVNAAGNNVWTGRELDTDAIEKFDSIVVVDVDQARIESGELMRSAETGHFTWSSAKPLCDVVAGKVKVKPRANDSDITLFESLGVAIEDIAVAKRVYQMAVEQGAGHTLPS